MKKFPIHFHWRGNSEEAEGNREGLVFMMIVEKEKIVLVSQIKYPKTLDELFEEYKGELWTEENGYGKLVEEELL